MFSKVIKDGVIPPNFINSILTNPSLYSMFKDDYENNKEYFQGLEKEEYLNAMLNFIEDTLFSSNIFGIYSEPENINEWAQGKLSYIRRFYDDFLLDEFRRDPESILKTRIFRGIIFAKNEDLYASKTDEFNNLFAYIFKESLDYDDIVDILVKDPVRKLKDDEPLSLKEFDTLCNYVKNNTAGFVSMDIVTKMLKNHAYKTNHIFDAEVVRSLVLSTLNSYLDEWGISAELEFSTSLEMEEKSEYSKVHLDKIVLDEELVDAFLSLNYTEIFTELFYKADLLKSRVLLEKNGVDTETLKTIMVMVTNKVDFTRLFIDDTYQPTKFIRELKISSFIKTLRFFSSFGVNLFKNFINSEIARLDIDITEADVKLFSLKEVSLDQKFFQIFLKDANKKSIIKRFAVLSLLFDANGNRLKTIDLIKKWMKTEHRAFLEEYLHSRIVDPEMMIEDVADLSSYRPKEESIRDFIERELKYIYVDSFYYSLDSILKLKHSPKFDKEEYLMDLSIKINCLKDTPLTHRFIDEALFTIEEAKQNI